MPRIETAWRVIAARASSPFYWSGLALGSRAAVNLFQLHLAALHLSLPELGLLTVMLSMGSLVTAVDGAVGANVQRAVAYVLGGATELTSEGYAGSRRPVTGEAGSTPATWSTLGALTEASRSVYRPVALAIFAVSLAAASWLGQTRGEPVDPGAHRLTENAAWAIFSVGALITLWEGNWLAVLTGINWVAHCQGLAVAGWAVNALVTVAGLQLGWRLAAFPAGWLAMTCLVRILGRRAWAQETARASRVTSPDGNQREPNRRLAAALWPNTRRQLAISAGAYLIMQANVVVCARRIGLTEAASYGVTLQLVSLAGLVGALAVQPLFPTFSQWRITRPGVVLARAFARAMRRLTLIYWVCVGGLLVVGPELFRLSGRTVRLLPLPEMALLSLIMFLEVHHSQYATLVLTENRNPFVYPALVSGVLVVGLGYFLAPRYGTWGLLLSQGVVQAGFHNWWCVWRAIRGLGLSTVAYAQIFVAGKGA